MLKILPIGRSREWKRPRKGSCQEKALLGLAVAGSLMLLVMAAGPPPPSVAQEPKLLQASASGEYSLALHELPDSIEMQLNRQERLLLDRFEQQTLDIQEDNRDSARRLREDAAEEKLEAREEHRDEMRELNEEYNKKRQDLSSDLPAEKYQDKSEDLREDRLDDTEDLRIDHERRINKIDKDLRVEIDEISTELEQTLFDLQTERQYALEQLRAEKVEASLLYHQRELEVEAMREIISSLGAGTLGDEVVFDILDYIRDRVYIEAIRSDLGSSKTSITVTIGAEPTTIEQAMELLGL